jgi:hypothetical protein
MTIISTKVRQAQLQNIQLPNMERPLEISVFALRVEVALRAYPTSLLTRACAAGIRRFPSKQLRAAASTVKLSWNRFQALSVIGDDVPHPLHSLARLWATSLRPELQTYTKSAFISPDEAAQRSFQDFIWCLEHYALGIDYVTANLAEMCAEFESRYPPEQVRCATKIIGLDLKEFGALVKLGKDRSNSIFDSCDNFPYPGRFPSDYEYHPHDAKENSQWKMLVDAVESEGWLN